MSKFLTQATELTATKIASEPASLSYEDFVTGHLYPRVPVIIRGAIAGLPCVSRWSPAFFREHYGYVVVSIQRRLPGVKSSEKSKADLDPYHMTGGHAMELRTYIDEITNSGHNGEKLPLLRNYPLHNLFPELQGDFRTPKYFFPNWLHHIGQLPIVGRLAPALWKVNMVEFFLGPTGGRFPNVHIDLGLTHAWIAQVYGQKKFWAWPPRSQDLTSVEPWSITVDPQPGMSYDAQLARLFEHTGPAVGIIGPGDVIFVPAGWWHTTEIQSTSISLSANFVNESNWPDFLRVRKHSMTPIKKCTTGILLQLVPVICPKCVFQENPGWRWKARPSPGAW
jgi:hypothetical protein